MILGLKKVLPNVQIKPFVLGLEVIVTDLLDH